MIVDIEPAPLAAYSGMPKHLEMAERMLVWLYAWRSATGV